MPSSPTNHDSSLAIQAGNETTPLLTNIDPTPLPVPDDPSLPPNNTEDEDGNGDEDEEERKPLPKTQIFLLCYTSCVAPIAFFSIFPYINFMIERVGGVGKEDVGFYSGLIESLFSATQMCVMIVWGKVCVFLFVENRGGCSADIGVRPQIDLEESLSW
jgi:hypothetical protein